MDETVRKVFGLKKTSGDVGIEIEVEGARLPDPDNYHKYLSDYWRIERDGSLRGMAWEYVLHRPCAIGDVTKVIDLLKKEFALCKSKITDSVRAGVHVHINVQELTLRQLATMITCYYALEELLITFCAPSRKGNHFCLRANDAEYSIFLINEFFSSRKFTLNNEIRYAALNLLSLKKYGSLEFRTLETPQNFDKVAQWADILYTFKENSLKYSDPVEVIESMSADGYSSFVEGLLGKHAKLFKNKDLEDLVIRGVRNAQNIAYGVDWNSKKGMKSVNSPPGMPDMPTFGGTFNADQPMTQEMLDQMRAAQAAAGRNRDRDAPSLSAAAGALQREGRGYRDRLYETNVEGQVVAVDLAAAEAAAPPRRLRRTIPAPTPRWSTEPGMITFDTEGEGG